MAGQFPGVRNAANGFLNSKIQSQLAKLRERNPLAGSALDNLIGNAFPGYGFPDDPNANIFDASIAEQVNAIVNEATQLDSTRTTQSSTNLQKSYDWRARLRPKAGGADQFYAAGGAGSGEGNGQSTFTDHLMRPIEESGGMVWQYTPTIFLSATANYNPSHMQGMNYPINTYINSTPPEIPVQSDWTANDVYEARYLLAVMTFLKVATKSYFGDSAVVEGKYGTPPPVLIFEYLGDHGFNKVPVVITNYNIQMGDDVDYVPVEVNGTVTYVPTKTNIMVNLTPTYTPHKLRRRFNIEDIANGVAYKEGFI